MDNLLYKQPQTTKQPEDLNQLMLMEMAKSMFSQKGQGGQFANPFLSNMIGKYLSQSQQQGGIQPPQEQVDYGAMIDKQKYQAGQQEQTSQNVMTDEINKAFDTIEDDAKLQKAIRGIGAKYQNATLAKWTLPGSVAAKPTVTERKDQSVRDWQDDKLSSEDLLRKYPTDTKMIKMIEKRRYDETPLTDAKGEKIEPLKQALSFWNRRLHDYADIDDKTAAYAATIKTNGDLMKFTAEMETLQSQGIDAKAILLYYKEIGIFEE